MEDLISRQDAIDVFTKWFYEVFGIGRSDGITTLLERLKEIPSAQPEIINCRECKHAKVADIEDGQDGYTCQFHRGSIWFSGSYCSWAERREE